MLPRLLLPAVVLLFLLGTHGLAQTQPTEVKPVEVSKPKDSQPTRSQVEELLKAVENAQQLDEATKAELTRLYKAALDWITISEKSIKKTVQYEAEVANAPKLIAEAEAQRATPAPKPSITFSAETTLQEMDQKLAEAKQQQSEADREYAQCEEELKHRDARMSELSKLTSEAQGRLDALKKQVTASVGSGEPTDQVSAQRVELDAHLASLENQLHRYQIETTRHHEFAKLLPLQQDLAQRKKNAWKEQVTAIEKAVDAKRGEESKRNAEETKKAQLALADSHPALSDLAAQNVKLAHEYEELVKLLNQAANDLTATENTLTQLQGDYKATQEKVKYAGNSSSIGPILRQKRDELPDTEKCEQYIRFVDQNMPKVCLTRIEYQAKRAALGDIDQVIPTLIPPLETSDTTDSIEVKKQAFLEQKARELLEQRRELLSLLIDDYNQCRDKLFQLDIGNRSIIEQTGEYLDYINERVLWVRSTEMLGPGEFVEIAKGFASLTRTGPWVKLARRCQEEAMLNLGLIFLILAPLVILSVMRPRLRNRLKHLCTTGSSSTKLKIWPTLEGLLLTATIAAPVPLLLAFAGWWMTSIDGVSDLGRAIGWGLRYPALLLWVAKFTRRLCLPGLIAESHFGWSAYSLTVVRRNLRRLTYCVLPLIFIVVFTSYYSGGAWENSVGRIAFIVTMLLLAAFMHIVFFSKNSAVREIIARNPAFWLARFRVIFYNLTIGLPLLMAVLAWIGYYYSAQQLALRLASTMALVLCLVLLHAVAGRWFLVRRRNLSIAQTRERQAREAENAEIASQNASGVVPVVAEPRDLSVIHQQLHYLLRQAIVVFFLVGCWMIWADVLPALNVLDNKEVWSSTVEMDQTHKDADGTIVTQKVPVTVTTTARHLLMAALILFATFVIGRHLPALLEITLLSRTHFDNGSRQAASILLRYLVGLIGLLMACRMMSITWSSVQWLAAAITVGLGFGLQEIFANFISGLILLFERPIRVGDVITLGDTTGTVTDIRIRTTTVTNWDRKELIVPNKELITGQLLNWTLKDPVNRIVINIGVAYDSDTRMVHDIVQSIAENHPDVMKQPGPKVTLDEFGQSTLNFVLRCYVANLDVRLDTIHSLHETILHRFKESGIEIAFPQLDVTLRKE